ncbi:MAG: tetratricopeptide repeat protein [Candidatus Omnitrophica bacterium]|nr:tetratricopeptide repeat protein [Candidatus Omnitrophota bacterium]
MNPEHKKYILESINKKSTKEIARRLNIKERKVRKFLEKENRKPTTPARLFRQKRAGGENQEPKTEIKPPPKKGTLLISIVLIIILGFAVYGNSLKGELIWDDEYLIKSNLYLRDSSYLTKLLTRPIGDGAGIESGSYRPLQMLMHMLEFSLWKLDVMGYHIVNTILHILAALGIFWFIYVLFGDFLMAFLTGALFAVHPIHTEAVAYISGRSDSLVTIFIILSLIFYIKYLHSGRAITYTVMLLCSIFAVLSKENGIILPILLLLYHYSFKKRLKIKSFLPVAGICFFYLFLRMTVLKIPSFQNIYPTTLLQRIPGFFVAITNYIKLLFLPFSLHMEYGYKIFSLNNPKAMFGIAITISLLLICVFRRRKKDNPVFFAISWFFITLIPQSNLYPVNAYMAEHWLYLPSVGFFLILARGLAQLYRKNFKTLFALSIIILLSFYIYLTVRQNGYWREPIAFYERTLTFAPESPRVYSDFGVAAYNTGRKDKAIELFKKAVELKPDYAEAFNNLGAVCSDIGKHEEAITFCKKAIELRPDYAGAYNNLGVAYNGRKRYEEAIVSYEKSLGMNPDSAEVYNNLGNLYISTGKIDEAIAAYKKAVKIKPDYADVYNNLGNTYKDKGKYEEAIALYKKAISLDPSSADMYYNLADAYNITGREEEAIGFYKKAIEIKPDFKRATLKLLELGRKKDLK